MIVTVREAGEITILAAEGRLDTASAPELDAECSRRVEGGVRHLVLDISDLDYISSAGLRVMLAAAKKMQACEGRFALCGARGLVQETLDLAGIGSIITVHDSVEDALGEES